MYHYTENYLEIKNVSKQSCGNFPLFYLICDDDPANQMGSVHVHERKISIF
jgi:hypothetical protein